MPTADLITHSPTSSAAHESITPMPSQIEKASPTSPGGKQHVGGHVLGVGLEHERAGFFAEGVLRPRQQQFADDDYAGYDEGRQFRHLAFGPEDDAAAGVYDELRSGEEKHEGKDGRCHGFGPAVPPGVPFVRRPCDDFCDGQRHYRDYDVGGGVDAVADYGEAASVNACYDLRDGEDKVADECCKRGGFDEACFFAGCECRRCHCDSVVIMAGLCKGGCRL